MKVSFQAHPHVSVQQASALERSARTPAGLPVARAPSPGLFYKPVSFRSIYDDWFEEVARWIRALGALEADREDIAQEVFLVVRRRLEFFDGTNPAGWLYRITRRQVRDFRRRTWVKHIFNKRRSDQPELVPYGGSSPATALELKEKQSILHALLQKMNEDRRGAFVLFEIEGLSGEEIARIQSIPLNTVWTRLHHARKEFLVLAAKYQKAHGQTMERQRPNDQPTAGKARQ